MNGVAAGVSLQVIAPAMGWTRGHHAYFFTDRRDGALFGPVKSKVRSAKTSIACRSDELASLTSNKHIKGNVTAMTASSESLCLEAAQYSRIWPEALEPQHARMACCDCSLGDCSTKFTNQTCLQYTRLLFVGGFMTPRLPQKYCKAQQKGTCAL